jgi:hypothetical protein
MFFEDGPRDLLLETYQFWGEPTVARTINKHTEQEVRLAPLHFAPLLFCGHDPTYTRHTGIFIFTGSLRRHILTLPVKVPNTFLETWKGPLHITVGKTILPHRAGDLSIWPASDVFKTLNEVTQLCQNLRSLQISFFINVCHLVKSEGEILAPLLRGYSGLQLLSFKIVFSDLGEFLVCFRSLTETLPQLISLHIELKCSGCGDALPSPDDDVVPFRNLKSLKVEGVVSSSVPKKGASVSFLCALVPKTLNNLDIRAFQLSRRPVLRNVLGALRRFTELQSLDLSFFGLTRRSASLIRKTLLNLRGLRSLGLYYEPTRGASSMCYVPKLSGLTSLKKLAVKIDLKGHEMEGEIDSNIIDLFEFPAYECGKLEELDFINHMGAFSLSRALFRGLKSLSLENADVTMFGNKGCWRHLPLLRVLRLVKCYGQYDRFFLAAEQLPNLEELCCSDWRTPGQVTQLVGGAIFTQFLKGVQTACRGLRRLTLWDLRVCCIEDFYRGKLLDLQEKLNKRDDIRRWGGHSRAVPSDLNPLDSPYDALCKMTHLECLSFGRIDSGVDDVTFMMRYGWKAQGFPQAFLPQLKELQVSCADEGFWLPVIRNMGVLKSLRVETSCAAPAAPDTFSDELMTQLNLREKACLRTLHLCFPEHPFRRRNPTVSTPTHEDEINRREEEAALAYALPRVAVSLRFSYSCTRGNLDYDGPVGGPFGPTFDFTFN